MSAADKSQLKRSLTVLLVLIGVQEYGMGRIQKYPSLVVQFVLHHGNGDH